MGKIFMIKFNIWRVTFLESFLPQRKYGMVFRFSGNNGNIVCALHLKWPEEFTKATVKFLKIWAPEKFARNHPSFWTMWLYHRVMRPNNADRMANSVDPDQTAPLGAVWSGSTLFAQTYLSKNLGSLR